MLVFVYILVFRLNFGVSVFRESKRPEAQPTAKQIQKTGANIKICSRNGKILPDTKGVFAMLNE